MKKTILTLGLFALLFVSCEKEESLNKEINSEEQQSKEFSALVEEALQQQPEIKSFGPVQTVDFVDLNRYAGRWFEIANFPSFFNLTCSCTTADYAPIEGGVSVFNNCTDLTSGNFNAITGRATIVDPVSNSKLQVFLGQIPIPGDYWIIDLVSFTKDGPYDFAVVSGPERDSLFILSRTPQINTIKQRLAVIKILVNLVRQGYDIRKIKVSPQFEDCVYPEL